MQNSDNIKEAFQKVKQDINDLKSETNFLKDAITEDRKKMLEMAEILLQLNSKISSINTSLKSQNPQIPSLQPFPNLLGSHNQNITSTDGQTDTSTHIPTDRHINQTYRHINQTYTTDIKPLNDQNQGISIGNEGVSTDRQTNQQTDRQTDIKPEISFSKHDNPPLTSSHNQSISKQNNPIKDASNILNSLDGIKKEIRNKFKRLTDQEILIFSTIYQLDEEAGYSDYKSLASRLNLTESSIRDYVGRLINKGIPVEKTKINNKSIQLNISPDLKKIASLPTILQLRDI